MMCDFRVLSRNACVNRNNYNLLILYVSVTRVTCVTFTHARGESLRELRKLWNTTTYDNL